jgi:phage terminase large subunit
MDTPRPRLGILEFAQSVLGIHPYPWQRRTLAHIEAGHPTALTACNGAGKTSTILVPAALWALFNWPLVRVIVTSASWSQLKKQFFDTIRQARFHPYFRRWTFNEAEIRSEQGGFIVGVSVDDAGRAEGYHDRPDSPVMILADEAKSIGTEVFESLARCTATFRVYASSAGPAAGTFYACLTTFRNFWACVLVKSSDCPHISKESIELDRAMWGEHSPQFRQKHLAEFTAEDEEAFISMETVRGCMDNPPAFSAGRSSTFIDWSTGRDETVIATASGNRLQIVAAFRERDAVQSVRRVASILRERGLTNLVSADAGGIGGPMCAQLSSDFGIYAARVNNGSPARKKEEFANADAEKWFAFRRLLEKREVILPVDGELLKQLSNRRLQYDAKARIQLEPKESMRARGLSSPDRADAMIGAAVMSLPGFTGGITLDTLAGMQFGRPRGRWVVFDSEPLTFD